MGKTAREVIADVALAGMWDGYGRDTKLACADRMIREIDAAGFVIVPKEPTQEMLTAGCAPSMYENPEEVRDIYSAMIAAASTPTGEKG